MTNKLWNCRAVQFRTRYQMGSDEMGQITDIFKRLFSADGKSANFERELLERKKSELKFKGLLESAPDAMVITDGNGKISMVNAQTERIFGFHRNEMIGKEVEFLIPQRFQTKHVLHREQYIENPKVRSMGAGMALFGKRKDGSEFPVEVSLSPMQVDDNEILILSAIRDTTKQKETEAEIKKINENLEKIVKERTRELEDALLNEKAIRLEMVKNQNRLKLLTEIGEIFASSLDISNTLVLLVNKLTQDFADWCSIDKLENEGELSCLVVSHSDQAKVKPLQELRKKYPLHLSIKNEIKEVIHSHKPIFLSEITESYIKNKAINQEHLNLLTTVGIRSAIVVPLLLRDSVYGLITVVIANSDKFYSDKDLELTKEVARGATISIERASLYKELQDINADLEQRVNKRTFELEAINKELEAFSYSVSHDLRAPLRSIDGFSNKILKDYSTGFDDQAKDYFNRIMNASRKMGTLIDDLLKLARLSRVEMKIESTNMTEIAVAIIGDLKETNPDRKVEVNIQENMIVTADRNLIQVALQNLLGNSWKYSKNVTLTTIEFSSFKQNTKTIYFIKDNGVGFDMKYVDKLFGAFQRLHSITEFEGTGIGLATVQRIIRRHHGNIWAESELNKGTTFYFTLNE